MIIYRIKDWDEHFENAASRKVEHCSWLPIKNKQDGLGYALLLRGVRGPARYGVWCAILLMLSKQKSPRLGWLTDDGTENGRPFGPYEIALKTKMPEKVIEDALEVLISPEIGWIEVISRQSSSQPDSETSALDSSGNIREGNVLNGMEGKEGKTLPHFERFYSAYPKHKGKANCLRWFEKNKPDAALVDRMIETIERFKASDGWADQQFIPHPFTWLNSGGWDDELTGGQSTAEVAAEIRAENAAKERRERGID